MVRGGGVMIRYRCLRTHAAHDQIKANNQTIRAKRRLDRIDIKLLYLKERGRPRLRIVPCSPASVKLVS